MTVICFICSQTNTNIEAFDKSLYLEIFLLKIFLQKYFYNG